MVKPNDFYILSAGLQLNYFILDADDVVLMMCFSEDRRSTNLAKTPTPRLVPKNTLVKSCRSSTWTETKNSPKLSSFKAPNYVRRF